jgi:hypothetical protein
MVLELPKVEIEKVLFAEGEVDIVNTWFEGTLVIENVLFDEVAKLGALFDEIEVVEKGAVPAVKVPTVPALEPADAAMCGIDEPDKDVPAVPKD